jgi:hypothetical protein
MLSYYVWDVLKIILPITVAVSIYSAWITRKYSLRGPKKIEIENVYAKMGSVGVSPEKLKMYEESIKKIQ